MIIEVDDKTGRATTYKSVMEFASSHSDDFNEYYKHKYTPKIQVELTNLQILQDLLPKGTSPIKKIYAHRNYIVVKCENKESYSLKRIGEYPYFQFWN